MSMTKFILILWMCSSVPGNECIKIPTPNLYLMICMIAQSMVMLIVKRL